MSELGDMQMNNCFAIHAFQMTQLFSDDWTCVNAEICNLRLQNKLNIWNFCGEIRVNIEY